MPPSASPWRRCAGSRAGRRFAGLANAVLRRVAAEGSGLLAGQDAHRAQHSGLALAALVRDLRRGDARRIAEASLQEPALDISLKPGADAQAPGPSAWAAACCRPARSGSPPTAASRTCRAMARAPGGCRAPRRRWSCARRAMSPAAAVADLCAAPGGKTASLAAAGAHVTAVDVRAAAARAGCARTCGASALPPRSSRPMSRPGRRAAPSMPSSSMRPAPRPAPSAATPTSCASRAPRTWAAWPRCSGPCSPVPQRWCGRAASSSTAPARSSPRRAAPRSTAFLERAAGLPPRADCGCGDRRRGRVDRRRRRAHPAVPLSAERGGIDGFYISRLQRHA